MRNVSENELLTLKAVFRRLVKLAGGTKHAAEVTRGSEPRISEYGAPDKMDRWPAIDQVADLELECGSPVMTRALADLQGFDLVQRDMQRPIGIHAHFARIIRETRDVELKMAEAMADNALSDAERTGILNECQEAINALQSLMAELRNKGLKAVK